VGALLAFLCGRRYYDFAMRYGAPQITGPLEAPQRVIGTVRPVGIIR
jgi:hypothetical protein